MDIGRPKNSAGEHPQDGALVCIWRNSEDLLSTIRGDFGHVSLKLVGPSYPRRERDAVYVSWWPKKRINRHRLWTRGMPARSYHWDERAAIPRYRREALAQELVSPEANERFIRDDPQGNEPYWGRQPDVKRFIPGATATAPFGLDLLAIETWWRAFRTAEEVSSFHILTRNCSVVVAKALRAGGAHDLAEKPKTHFPRPTEIERWAVAMASRCAERNGRIAAVTQRTPSPRLQVHSGDTVWTASEWKRQTTGRSLKWSNVRVEHLLGRYEKQRGDTKSVTAACSTLRKILKALHEDTYHAGAPGHAPLGPITTLTLQCLGALDHWRFLGTRRTLPMIEAMAHRDVQTDAYEVDSDDD